MSYPQIDVYDETITDWQTCDILGVGSHDGTWLVPVELIAAEATATVPTDPSSVAAHAVNFDTQAYGIFNVHSGTTLNAAYAHDGAYGCRLTPDPGTGITSLTSSGSFPGGKRWVSFSMWFRLVTLPGSSQAYMNLFELGNSVPVAPKSQFTVFFKNNALIADFNAGEELTITGPLTDTNWHRIEARVDFGSTTYTAYMRLDGGATLVHTSANNKTSATAEVLWIHYPNVAVDYTMDVDSVLLTTADSDPGWLREV